MKSNNLDILCLFLFVVMFASILFYDEISEMLSPIIHDVVCGDVAAPTGRGRRGRQR